MRSKLGLLLLALLVATPAAAMERIYGWCEQGGVILVVPGFRSISQPVQSSAPGCSVQVYLTTTLTNAPLYGSDNILDPISNPTHADSTGYWFFYTPNARLDVRFSGGGIPTPFTLADVMAFDTGSGGAGPPNLPITGTDSTGLLVPGTYTATGGVSRTATSKLSDHLSILDYGADPTHSFDSSPEIQAALDAALAAGGGTVDMPHGWYLCNSPVTVNNTSFLPEFGYGVKVNVEGDGNATVLDYKGASGRFFTEAAGGAPSDRNSFFRDFQIVCSGPGMTVSSLGVPGTGLADGFGVQNITSSEISNITVYNCGHGFTFDTPGVGWTEESDLHGLRSLNNAVGFWFTSSTATPGNSFEFTHGADLWCGFNMVGYTPDSCVLVDAGESIFNSRISIGINWGVPVTDQIAAIHFKPGANAYSTTWWVGADGANAGYRPNLFLDEGAISLGNVVWDLSPWMHLYNGADVFPAAFTDMLIFGTPTAQSTAMSIGYATVTKSLTAPELTTLEHQNSSNIIVNGTPTDGVLGQPPPGWIAANPAVVLASDSDPFGNAAQKVVYGTSTNFTSPPGPVTNHFGIIPGDIYYVTGYYKVGDPANVANWYFTFADGENGGYNVPVGMPAGGNPTTWTPFSFTHTVPTTALVGGPTAYLNWGNGRATSDWIKLYGVACRFAGPGPALPIFATNEAAIAGGLTNGMEYQTGGDPSLVAVVNSITNINTVPPVPTGLTAAPGNTQNVLNWLADVGATLYNVKGSTTSGGPYTGIATVAAPTVTYTNTGLTNGVPYYYVLSASNPIGESANSAQVSATPSAAAPGTYRPTTFANTGNYPAINAPAAYDGNLTTPAQVFGAIVYTPMNGDTTWSGFATTSGPWTSAILTIYSKELRAGTTPGTAILEYSLDGGSTWTALHSTTGTWDKSVTPDTVALGGTQALNLVKVQAVQPAPGVGQDTILVYEIFISAY